MVDFAFMEGDGGGGGGGGGVSFCCTCCFPVSLVSFVVSLFVLLLSWSLFGQKIVGHVLVGLRPSCVWFVCHFGKTFVG